MNHILVSACLLGLQTRYDGTTGDFPEVREFLADSGATAIPVCPEQLAGMPTPRPPCRFTRGDGDAVLDGPGELRDSNDRVMNDTFIHGARQVLSIAGLSHCRRALLKENSPSCGSRNIYLEDRLVEGRGVTTALLRRNGIEVISEAELKRSKD